MSFRFGLVGLEGEREMGRVMTLEMEINFGSKSC